jgi:hypothetical protein
MLTRDQFLNLATDAAKSKGTLAAGVAEAFKTDQLDQLIAACSAASESQLDSLTATISRVSKDIKGQRWGWSKKTKTLQPTTGSGGRKAKTLPEKLDPLIEEYGLALCIQAMVDKVAARIATLEAVQTKTKTELFELSQIKVLRQQVADLKEAA